MLAVGEGLETAITELTKQMRSLIQEVRGMKNHLDSIDIRLAKVEAWAGRLVKMETLESRLGSRLDTVEQELREPARSDDVRPPQGVNALLGAKRGIIDQNARHSRQ